LAKRWADILAQKWKNSSLNGEKPRVCVSIAPKNATQFEELLKEANLSQAHLIELRVDGLVGDAQSFVQAFLRNIPSKPLVLTYNLEKPVTLGGTKDGLHVFFELARYASYLDAPDEITQKVKHSAKRIASLHFSRSINFEEGIKAIDDLAKNHDVVKLVFLAEKLEDNYTALKLASSTEIPRIIFCMGELGFLSRFLAPFCGCVWTYASLKRGTHTAAGQVDVDTLIKMYQTLLR